MQVPERGKGRGCEIENRPRQVDVCVGGSSVCGVKKRAQHMEEEMRC